MTFTILKQNNFTYPNYVEELSATSELPCKSYFIKMKTFFLCTGTNIQMASFQILFLLKPTRIQEKLVKAFKNAPVVIQFV